MLTITLTQKGIRASAVVSAAEYTLQSDPEIVARGEEEKDYDGN